jgi:hypothetical protein
MAQMLVVLCVLRVRVMAIPTMLKPGAVHRSCGLGHYRAALSCPVQAREGPAVASGTL